VCSSRKTGSVHRRKDEIHSALVLLRNSSAKELDHSSESKLAAVSDVALVAAEEELRGNDDSMLQMLAD
jgi:hypothetical protein